MSAYCPHGLNPEVCPRCVYGTGDVLEAEVMAARDGLEPLAADIAEAFIRRAGMIYLDGQTAEELAVIAAGIARKYQATGMNARRREIDSELGRLVFWGSECHGCGNATVGSMVCDNCGTMDHTKALWTEPQNPGNPAPALPGV